MHQHWKHLSDSKRSMIYSEGLFLINSKIEIPESCIELIFNIPCLTLINDTKLVTGIGACIVRSRNSKIGNEHIIV